MKGKYSADTVRLLLIEKQKTLAENGIERFPQRSDFSDEEVCAIKAFLGPWPRALEAAGLKAAPEKDRQQLNREKRIRAKRARTAALKLQRDGEREPNGSEENKEQL